jgi:hypothetical protein
MRSPIFYPFARWVVALVRAYAQRQVPAKRNKSSSVGTLSGDCLAVSMCTTSSQSLLGFCGSYAEQVVDSTGLSTNAAGDETAAELWPVRKLGSVLSLANRIRTDAG